MHNAQFVYEKLIKILFCYVQAQNSLHSIDESFLICDVSLDAPAVLIKAQWHEREQRFNTAENLCGVKSAGESSFIITNL